MTKAGSSRSTITTTTSFIENEIKLWRQFKSNLEISLRRYPTTLDEDIDILRTVPRFTNRRNAIILRSNEKQVLHYWLSICQSLLKNLLEILSSAQQDDDERKGGDEEEEEEEGGNLLVQEYHEFLVELLS